MVSGRKHALDLSRNVAAGEPGWRVVRHVTARGALQRAGIGKVFTAAIRSGGKASGVAVVTGFFVRVATAIFH
jgi:hypothetical protein